MKIPITHVIVCHPSTSLKIPIDDHFAKFTETHLISPPWLEISYPCLNSLVHIQIGNIRLNYRHQRSKCGFLAHHRHKSYSFLTVSSTRRWTRASKDSPNFPIFLRFSTVSFFRLIVVYMDYVRITRLTEVIFKIWFVTNHSVMKQYVTYQFVTNRFTAN